MNTRLNATAMRDAHRHLARVDPALGAHLPGLRPCRLHVGRSHGFSMLIHSILGQQLSTSVAATLKQRLAVAAGGRPLQPQRVATLSHEALRGIGLSNAKARYVRGIATAVVDGTLNFRRLARLADAEVIDELTALPGVGPWTAQMFLMFGLRRPDVMAPLDLGLQRGIQRLDGLADRPDPDAVMARSACWAPYRSVASWYLWRIAD